MREKGKDDDDEECGGNVDEWIEMNELRRKSMGSMEYGVRSMEYGVWGMFEVIVQSIGEFNRRECEGGGGVGGGFGDKRIRWGDGLESQRRPKTDVAIYSSPDRLIPASCSRNRRV